MRSTRKTPRHSGRKAKKWLESLFRHRIRALEYFFRTGALCATGHLALWDDKRRGGGADALLGKELGPRGITANVVAPCAGSEIHSEPCPREVDSGSETDRRRVESVVAMFFGAALGAVVIHYSISAPLWLATTISAVCNAALFRSVRTSNRL